MPDNEKLKLIDLIIADAWEYGSFKEQDAFYQGVLSAVASVVNFGGEDND